MRILRGVLPLLLAASLPAQAHEYPTAERVVFVLECMRDHPGPEFEMLHKCSCALDRIAEALPYEAFVEGSTLAKAVTIAGERGGVLRDNEGAQAGARGFRALYKEARRQCMFRP
jgi:hypothetical protein